MDIWRRCNGDVEIASIRTRTVSIRREEWSEVSGHTPE